MYLLRVVVKTFARSRLYPGPHRAQDGDLGAREDLLLRPRRALVAAHVAVAATDGRGEGVDAANAVAFEEETERVAVAVEGVAAG